MSQTIADHRGVFIGLCLAMVVWFGLGGFALRNDGGGEEHRPAAALHRGLAPEDILFWGAVAGAFVTLVGGFGWFHRQMEMENAPAGADEQTLAAEIARFKEEKTQSAREARLQRLKDRSGS